MFSPYSLDPYIYKPVLDHDIETNLECIIQIRNSTQDEKKQEMRFETINHDFEVVKKVSNTDISFRRIGIWKC